MRDGLRVNNAAFAVVCLGYEPTPMRDVYEPHLRLALFVLGVIAVIVCVNKPAEAQNGAWCLYTDGDGGGSRQCRYATLQQCLVDRLGGSSCSPSPYPTSPELPPQTRRRRH